MSLRGQPPIIIAHRGASAVRPEHTLESYRVAIDQGADFIEPDLVSTKDGVLIARHENEISATTNVEDFPEFAQRRTTKIVDGHTVIGWFTEDFTLAEIKKLSARERIPKTRTGNVAYNDRFEIPTLQEIIDLAKQASWDVGRVIGVYPETKHPTYFQNLGLSLEKRLVDILHKNDYVGRDAPVFIQSFETANLKTLRSMTEVKLIQLLSDHGKPYDFVVNKDPRSYTDLITEAGLAEIALYADGVGPHKALVIPRDSSNRLAAPTKLVEWAHTALIEVHPWTFRPENEFLPAEFQRAMPHEKPIGKDIGDSVGEIRRFIQAGVDGVFTDLSTAGRTAIQLERAK